MSHRALAFKEEGNVYFTNGNYTEAEICYTKAIQKDSSNPKLFTNRAITRLRLQQWEPCLSDCLHAISLDPASMKSYYYLSQAQLALNHPNEAYTSALTAYEKCVETWDKSIQSVSNLVLRCKKAKWEVRERERERARSPLLKECEDALRANTSREIAELNHKEMGEVQRLEEKAELEQETQRKCDEIRTVFAVAKPKDVPRREVPDYLVDNVTFAIMHDPVTTKTGTSYDRSTMVEHLKRSQRDPLTGEPLTYADLRPNRALKEASEKFLGENGWAVDW